MDVYEKLYELRQIVGLLPVGAFRSRALAGVSEISSELTLLEQRLEKAIGVAEGKVNEQEGA